tara:strand:+ start:1121 stop:1315 length:195 start_codon:yes stop_codon:yes gene_type:complete
MIPKQKAKELVQKFNKDSRFWDCYNDVPLEERHDKNCALICVDEIIKATGEKYWQEVKQEIEKL